MTTVRDICTRALRRIRVIDATEQPAADDEQLVFDQLNDMMFGWKASGIDVAHQGFASINDTFAMFVPPRINSIASMSGEGRLARALAALSYQGSWDADTNTPTLESSVGTTGHLYRVSVAGSSTLDAVSAWAINDYLIFDGTDWLKGQLSRPFESGLSAMLAVHIAGDFGREPSSGTFMEAGNFETSLHAAFAVPAQPAFDRGIVNTPSRRFVDYT